MPREAQCRVGTDCDIPVVAIIVDEKSSIQVKPGPIIAPEKNRLRRRIGGARHNNLPLVNRGNPLVGATGPPVVIICISVQQRHVRMKGWGENLVGDFIDTVDEGRCPQDNGHILEGNPRWGRDPAGNRAEVRARIKVQDFPVREPSPPGRDLVVGAHQNIHASRPPSHHTARQGDGRGDRILQDAVDIKRRFSPISGHRDMRPLPHW